MSRLQVVSWIAVGGVLLALLAALIPLRQMAQREDLAGLIERHEREGRGTTLAAFLEREPPLDADVQARYMTWEASFRTQDLSYPSGDFEAWFLERAEGPPEALLQAHTAMRPAMEELAAILATDRLRLSSVATVRAAIGEAEPDFKTISEMKLVGAWSLVEAAVWFELEALRGDPDGALSALASIHAALRPVGNIMDAMLLMSVGSRRDRTHVLLATRGMLPAERREAWLAEAAIAPSVLADAFRGARILYALPLARALARGEIDAARRVLLHHRPHSFWGRVDFEVYLRWEALGDAERNVDLHARVADALRDASKRGPFEETEAWKQEAGYLIRTPLASNRQWMRHLFGRRTMHRVTRLAVRAITLDADGALPASDAALRERLGEAATTLDEAPWSAALRYEQLTERRFRIALDPAGALPELLDETQCAEVRKSTRLGSEALKTPFTLDEYGTELQLP